MNPLPSPKSSYSHLVYRPFWITIACLLLISAIALGLLIKSAWNAAHRTEPLAAQIVLVDELQRYSAMLDDIDSSGPDNESQQLEKLHQLATDINATFLAPARLNTSSHQALLHIATQLENANLGSAQPTLTASKKELREVLHMETHALNQSINLLAHDNHLELETSTFIAISLPVIGMLMLFFLRHRILRPLDGLGLLINRLGHQTVMPDVQLKHIDPLLRPLFENFGRMVQRLSELEIAQQKHQQELEGNVRLATQSLLEYHHTLAQSERLAAVGELTAGLAHELRNPLAGIHLALANLRSDTTEPDHIERLTLVIESLQNITQLLNHVLNQSQHTPEPASRFQLAETISSLLQLVRYQISANIRLEQRINDDIFCYLPQGRLRQAILNLVLNAAQSIEKKSGHIVLEAYTEQQRLIIRVTDDGPGFPQHILASGVQPFVTGREHGTGLGLSMVRRFCHEQGGTLQLSNPDQGGACVTMTLPWNQ
ncbi:MAG: HAMP domain-containing histidine kinase [Gammaproteobacteria bacterium]|nr:HAMP domain-containing histidine kinase [Gammaproteobacteria bacterium]